MTEKEIALGTFAPDDWSLEEIAERIEFITAVQKGLDQLDRAEGIPHDEVKNSWPHGLQTNLVSRCTRRLPATIYLIERDNFPRQTETNYFRSSEYMTTTSSKDYPTLKDFASKLLIAVYLRS
jgi:hypothetical protein